MKAFVEMQEDCGSHSKEVFQFTSTLFPHLLMPHATQIYNTVPPMTQSATSEICKDARWHLTLITC